MTNIINIKNENGKQLVSARELYLGLGLNSSQWARWSTSNIENNKFFKENIDWVVLDIMSSTSKGGQVAKDYGITTEFAKHIAMMANTEKSHMYRNYFINCEQNLIALRENMILELQNKLQIENKVLETKGLLVRDVANFLNSRFNINTSMSKLFRLLNSWNWIATKRNGYKPTKYGTQHGFVVSEVHTYIDKDNCERVKVMTTITMKGMLYLLDRYTDGEIAYYNPFNDIENLKVLE